MFDYSARQCALREALKRRGLAGILLSATDHMRYLTGWAEAPGERLVGLWVPAEDAPSFLVPLLYRSDVIARACGDARIEAYHDTDGWQSNLSRMLATVTDGSEVAVDEELHAGHLLEILRLAPTVRWLAAASVMTELRGVKSSEEIAALRASAAIADDVYCWTLGLLRCGATEMEIQDAIGRRFRECGASSSWAIVAFGANTAIPHHRSSANVLRRGDMVVLDLGCGLNGYQSDITRTVSYGPASPEAAIIYTIVHRAHQAALQSASPGVPCREVDRAARTVITEAGYGDRFIHRTGHGIGLSTHERPDLSESETAVIQPGMCFSDEPGIYLDGRFGVRIENIITIVDDGAVSLNAPAPGELLELED